MRIIFGGVVSRFPFIPGSVCHRMQYVLGLQRLGHEVYYVEQLSPEATVDRNGEICGFSDSVNRRLFEATMRHFGLWGRACQIYGAGGATSGLAAREIASVATRTDLLINFSGHVTWDPIVDVVRVRAYIDQDPVYTQLWVAEYGVDLGFSRHDVFFSAGLNIGTSASPIPDCGVQWNPVIPPIVLDGWRPRFDRDGGRFTTIASWSDYGDVAYGGEWFGSKRSEFARFVSLPLQAHQEMEVALRNPDDEGRMLSESGWNVSSARTIAGVPAYRAYIAKSRAGICISKNAYVKAQSGWFGDRTSHYLAMGKPVLAQSTGYERLLPTGEGLVTFTDIDDAIAGVNAINSDYLSHCRAARAFAHRHLDAAKVLPKMLDLCEAA